MPTFQSSLPHEHGLAEALGVLVVNLGTPDAPTAAAVRRYLAEFLWDPRVVEVPRPLWWLVLHGVILRIRPARSARAYAKIWTDAGSPLLLNSADIAQSMSDRLQASMPYEVHVALAMNYGQPSIASALEELHNAGVRRLVVLPLYPQYSGSTTASVFDKVTSLLSRQRWVPELKFIADYHDEPGYIDAVAASVREFWDENGRGDKLLMSFHGIPQQMVHDGDPYYCQSRKTARLLAEALRLGDDDWALSFQSRVGRAEWLRPYTDETISELGRQALGRLDVVCPGFAADCLETLEEIAMQYGELFSSSGGGELRYIPALNARADHVEFLSRLVESGGNWTKGESIDALDESRRRAIAMGASQ